LLVSPLLRLYRTLVRHLLAAFPLPEGFDFLLYGPGQREPVRGSKQTLHLYRCLGQLILGSQDKHRLISADCGNIQLTIFTG
jgi:hypothetical protein